jgi:hypothetical protein
VDTTRFGALLDCLLAVRAPHTTRMLTRKSHVCAQPVQSAPTGRHAIHAPCAPPRCGSSRLSRPSVSRCRPPQVGKPVLLAGPGGCGKSALVRGVLARRQVRCCKGHWPGGSAPGLLLRCLGRAGACLPVAIASRAAAAVRRCRACSSRSPPSHFATSRCGRPPPVAGLRRRHSRHHPLLRPDRRGQRTGTGVARGSSSARLRSGWRVGQLHPLPLDPAQCIMEWAASGRLPASCPSLQVEAKLERKRKRRYGAPAGRLVGMWRGLPANGRHHDLYLWLSHSLLQPTPCSSNVHR